MNNIEKKKQISFSNFKNLNIFDSEQLVMLKGGIQALRQISNPCRLIHFCVDMRCFLDDFFNKRTPYKQVQSESWYEPEIDQVTKKPKKHPSRQSHLIYWIKKEIEAYDIDVRKGTIDKIKSSDHLVKMLNSYGGICKKIHSDGKLGALLNISDQEIKDQKNEILSDLYNFFYACKRFDLRYVRI
ncbi:hypothetical protein BMT55_02075 [Listeria newyorkensis]|uniref:Predicted pPIWI-associating nuclease domain-containing protein n=1 Tax=Listeria newyorkensis TaxID=1497681 RepID=A0ABX4XQ58_9LIST|nr:MULTISPECIES: hypothetical protein [Listeria]KGL42228.1 hypothetical protein EP56_10870 [Listeriaceae bacterium FSL A5-0209]KGL38179.1 hypothetical protein EP58_15590 [Listeria newyorkensis]PNP94298.1 hypothetical protein BMT55_02075 [Listeria newyorkensis]RQW67744.1 hypothetical protein DUK53_05355 [Listeria sp. SHR_NRA_18]WAO22713.1 hypothetical protein OTR81_05415 [Listeria newyorkensis]